jgi:soluble lytic murein transglycosylase
MMPAKARPTGLPGSVRFIALLMTLSVLLGLAQAASVSRLDSERLAEQRRAFLRAERALKQGDRPRFEQLLASLGDYPLYPYLIYADLEQRLSTAPAGEVESFLEDYADTPLAPRLRRAWLKTLYRQGRWSDVTRAYRPTADSATRCRYLHALYQTGKRDAALDQVEELWLVGYSQPPACDAVFDIWRQAGRLTPALTWARVRLAMRSGYPGLAGYLARFLPRKERDLVVLWRRMRSSPASVLKSGGFPADHPLVPEILAYGIQRLARQAPEQAAQEWQKLKDRYAFSDEQVAEVRRSVGLALAAHHKDDAMAWLASIDDRHADERVRETRVLTALQDWQWREAIGWMDKLKDEERNNERWQYWRARSLDQLGEKGLATGMFANLASRRSFYGFLAADRVDTNYQLNEVPLGLDETAIDAVSWIPGIRRARELHLLGRTVNARREWYLTTRQMAPEQLAAAAVLAHRWGWHDRAILTVGRTGRLDDLSLRFPLAFRKPVMKEAQTHAIEPAWVFAVMRQESAFSPDAQSPAGAMGLMQLMPRTARQVARKLNTRIQHQLQLFDADTNIRLGSAYLRRLLNELDGHEALATAAYNAGPARVRSWLPESETMPSDLWIEAVPFSETRHYVKRVFTYTAIYENRLGQDPKRLSGRLGPVPSTLNGARPGKG